MSKKENVKSPVSSDSFEEITPLNIEQERILNWLKTVRFKKNTFGGVVEADVWKKLAELNSMYNSALMAERVRYDALLEKAKADLNNSDIGEE